jgi:hypothetical protein
VPRGSVAASARHHLAIRIAARISNPLTAVQMAATVSGTGAGAGAPFPHEASRQPIGLLGGSSVKNATARPGRVLAESRVLGMKLPKTVAATMTARLQRHLSDMPQRL